MMPPTALDDRDARTGARRSQRPVYRPLSGLVVRAPLLPAADYGRLGSGTGGTERAWDDPAVRFAVSIASPDLAAALSVPGGVSRSPARALAALQRYVIRACLRPTPFGGFAAVAICRWADRTTLRIAAAERPTRSRPDMDWLTAVAQRLAEEPACRPGLRVFTNTCALERAGRIYLSEGSPGAADGAADLSVRATPVVRHALARARPGVTLEELKRHVLAFSPRATAEKADRLIGDLCECRLLIPELLPALTADPLGHVIGQLAGVPAAAGHVARLSAIGAECARLDDAEPAIAAAALPAVRARMRELASSLGVTRAPERAAELQVDSALPLLDTGITRQIADDVIRAVDVLFQLHPAPRSESLAAYKAAFHRRYGDGRRVPLLEMLDPRFGIGPPGNGDHDHSWHRQPGHGGECAHRAEVLQHLLAASIRDGRDEVVLDADLIERLSTWVPDPRRLPPSLELSVFVTARSRAAVDRGDYRLVIGPNLGAGAAGRGLGRFADMLGRSALGLLREAADAEAAETGLIAELVHRPVRARSANVVVRPLVRGYEIPVGVAPSLPPDAVIRMDELSVLLRDGRLRIWWERAGRELDLATGHMLNSAGSPPLCRQLVTLASDGVTGLAPFDWGPLSAMPFLPRLRFGRVVLHPAQWRLDPRDEGGPACHADPARFAAWLENWRLSWRLPRHVYLTHADNRLLLDLDDAGHREQLRTALGRAGRPAAVLQEGLPGPDDAWLPGPRGRHVVELVVPVVRTRRATGTAGRCADRAPEGPGGDMPRWPDTDRIRRPGSDWLYLIFSGSRASEDALIAGSLGALADHFVERGDADGWFYVRYSDPEPQLRLRVHGDAATLTDRVLPALAGWGARAIAEGARTRLTVETYERELERYGGPAGTEICERIACVDSRCARLLLGASAPPDRLEVALVSTASLTASLVRDPAERLGACQDIAGPAARSGVPFRERQARLRALVATMEPGRPAAGQAGEDTLDPPWRRVRQALEERQARLAPLVERLTETRREGTALRPARELLPSLVHMHANRLGLNRADEQLMLGLLSRTLRSVHAYTR